MKILRTLLATSLILLFVSCGDNTTTSPVKDVSSLSIDDTNLTLHSTDLSKTVSATATYTDGSTADATTSLFWSSSDSNILSVSQGELIPGALNGGNVTISVSYENYVDTSSITVHKLSDYNASFPDINATGTYIFQAYGNFDNGDTNVTIARNIVWSADNGAVVETTDGVASIILYTGDTNVTATVFGDTNTSSPIGPQSKIYTIN